jgi:predicted metal-binding protein
VVPTNRPDALAHAAHANGSPITVFVCVSCGREQTNGADAAPGTRLAAALERRLAANSGVIVAAVECLAVCKRPCTIALTGAQRWTYVIGDLDPAQHADEVAAAALAYQASDNGIVPWKDRPQTFRKGVISRIPPLGFIQPEAKIA